MATLQRVCSSGVLALAFVLGSASSSAAPSGPARSQAGGQASQADDNGGAINPQERFAAAQKLFDQGDHAAALDVFREVYATTKSPNARLMMGYCLLQLGRAVEAYDELSRAVLEAGKRAEAEPKYARTRDAAATEVARLELKVGKLVVALADPAASDVTLNGVLLSADRIGVPIAVDPGEIVVTAKGPGRGSERFLASVRAGEIKTVTVVFKEREAKSARSGVTWDDAAKRSPSSEGTFVSRGGVRALGFVTASVGVLGMATFGVAGSMVQSKLATLEAECGAARCRDPKYADVVDSGKTLTVVTNIGLVTGIAGLAVGGAMIALGGAAKTPVSGAEARIAVGLSPSGLIAVGSF